MFSLAVAAALVRGDAPDCHCFGQLHSAATTRSTLARDAALTGIAVFVLIAAAGDPGPSPVSWIGGRSSGLAIALGAGALLAAILAFQLWFSLELLRQHGRVLNRLDDLQAQLAGEASASVESPGSVRNLTARTRASRQSSSGPDPIRWTRLGYAARGCVSVLLMVGVLGAVSPTMSCRGPLRPSWVLCS